MADSTPQTPPASTSEQQAQGQGQPSSPPQQPENPLFTLLADILGGDMNKFMKDIEGIGKSLNSQVAMGPQTDTAPPQAVAGGPGGQQVGGPS